jgi:hypothetical protein
MLLSVFARPDSLEMLALLMTNVTLLNVPMSMLNAETEIAVAEMDSFQLAKMAVLQDLPIQQFADANLLTKELAVTPTTPTNAEETSSVSTPRTDQNAFALLLLLDLIAAKLNAVKILTAERETNIQTLSA